MQNSVNNDKSSKLLSEGILILILTVMVYLISFNYYIGYCSFYVGNFDSNIGFLDYYRIPSIFTDLSLYKLIVFSYKFLIVVIFFLLCIIPILLVVPKDNNLFSKINHCKYTIFMVSIIFVFNILPIIKFKVGLDFGLFKTLGLRPLLIILFLEVLLPLAFAVIFKIKVSGLNNKIRYVQNELYKKNLLFCIINRFRSFFIIFLTFGLLVPFSTQIGYMDGKTKVEYCVLNKDSNSYIVVDTNGEDCIVVPFNIRDRTFSPSFSIVSKDIIIEQKLAIQYKEIGPLKRE